MRVDALIKILQAYPPSMQVMVDGYEDGFHPLKKKNMGVMKLAKSNHDLSEAWWSGPYQRPDRVDKKRGRSCLILSRTVKSET